MGYFWPNMFQYVKKYSQACDSYQRMGQLNKLDEMSLQPQLVVEPFDIWALYFLGTINPSSRQKVYMLVCTDYMTKWVEFVALVKYNDQYVIDFLYGEIFTHFGVPREIVAKGGPQFVSRQMEDLF